MSVNHPRTAPSDSEHREPYFGPSLLLAGVCILVRMALLARTGSTAEDFYITLRISENLAEGRGFGYNPGSAVLGTTTPLYCLFLAALHWLGMPAAHLGKLANIAADGAVCVLLYRLARAIRRPELGPIAAAIYAFSPANITWAISGMETALVTMAGVAAFTALAERRPMACSVWCAVLTLLRLDGLLVVLVAAPLLAARHRREALRCLGVYLLLVAPWLVYATFTFGSPIPSSLAAKLSVYRWRNPGFPNLAPWLQRMAGGPQQAVLAAGFVLGTWVVCRQRAAAPLRPAVLWLAAYYGLLATSKGFLFGWYFIPPTPIYVLTASLGWHAALLRLRASLQSVPDWEGAKERAYRASHLTAAGILALAGAAWMPRVVRDLDKAQEMEERLRKPIGLELRTLVQPGETLMLEPIGYIGYYSRARVLDTIGLVSPEVVKFYRDESESPAADILAHFLPEWVLLRAGEVQQIERASAPNHPLFRRYRVVRRYSDPSAPQNAPAAFTLYRRVE